MISTAIPGTVLAFVITFGGAIYKSEGLELVNPRDRNGFTDYLILSNIKITVEVVRDSLKEKMEVFDSIDGQK